MKHNVSVNPSISFMTAGTALLAAVFAVASCVSGIAQAVTQNSSVIEEWNVTAGGSHSRHIFSPDGSLEAHLGPRAFADGLFVKNVATGEDRLILNKIDGLEVFSDLSFSPDGQRVMFLAGGGTAYYSSNVFTVRIDGSELRQLTDFAPGKWLSHDNEYVVDSALFSPDGQHILVKLIHGESHETSVGLISPTSQKQAPVRLADGEPLFWSGDGSGVYYAGNNGMIYRASVETKQSAPTSIDARVFTILGKVPGTDAVFVLKRQANVIPKNTLTVMSLDGTQVAQSLTDAAASIPFRDSEGRDLGSIDAAGPHQLLLTYDAHVTQPNVTHQQLVSFQ